MNNTLTQTSGENPGDRMLNQPKSIEKVILPDAGIPDEYEGLLYKFTNLDNGKMYIGVHKGKFDDGYFHTSKNAEFRGALATSTSRFSYEIMQFGNYDRMTVTEYEILKMVDAPKSDKYYNMNWGSPQYHIPRTTMVEDIADGVMAGNYPTAREAIDLVKDLERKQVRVEDFQHHVAEIQQQIDEGAGNTDHLYCVVIVDPVTGDDVVVGGNHSIMGILKSKHGQGLDINVVRVPENVTEDLSPSEVSLLGNLLNKRDKNPRETLNEADSIKQLETNHADKGTPALCDSNTKMLVAMGWTKKKSQAIQKKAAKNIENHHASLVGKVRINWNTGRHKRMLTNQIAEEMAQGKIAMAMGSGMFRFDRVLEAIFAQHDYADIQNVPKKTDVRVYMKHGSEADFNSWNMGDKVEKLRIFQYFCESLGVTVDLKDLEQYEADQSKHFLTI